MSLKDNKGFILSVISGTFIAVISTLIGVLIFAGVIKISDLSYGVIKPVNQFIKVLSVFLGCFFGIKGNKGLIKGILIGVLSTFLTYVIISIMGKETLFSLAFLIDIIFSVIIGGIVGIIVVNIRRKGIS